MLTFVTDLSPVARKRLYDLFALVALGLTIASLYGFNDPNAMTVFGLVAAAFGYTARSNTPAAEEPTEAQG